MLMLMLFLLEHRLRGFFEKKFSKNIKLMWRR